MRADEARLDGTERRIDSLGLRVGVGCYVQQLTSLGEVSLARGVGDQPVVADAMKAAGQHMQQEAAHELVAPSVMVL